MGFVCPECANGKHMNCTNEALDEGTDSIVPCDCCGVKLGEGGETADLEKLLESSSHRWEEEQVIWPGPHAFYHLSDTCWRLTGSPSPIPRKRTARAIAEANDGESCPDCATGLAHRLS